MSSGISMGRGSTCTNDTITISDAVTLPKTMLLTPETITVTEILVEGPEL
jgi:hypothetical protein